MISAKGNIIINPDPTKVMNTRDAGTDGLKFDLPEGQMASEELGNGDTCLHDFNSASPDAHQDVAGENAAWNAATSNGQASEENSISAQGSAAV